MDGADKSDNIHAGHEKRWDDNVVQHRNKAEIAEATRLLEHGSLPHLLAYLHVARGIGTAVVLDRFKLIQHRLKAGAGASHEPTTSSAAADPSADQLPIRQ